MVDNKDERWRTDVEVAVKSGGGDCWVAMFVMLWDWMYEVLEVLAGWVGWYMLSRGVLSPKSSADAVAEDGGCAGMMKVELKYEMVSYCANITALSVLLSSNALYAPSTLFCV